MKTPPRSISLHPQPAFCLKSFVLITHLLAASAPFFSNLPNPGRYLLLAMIMFSGYLLWRQLIARSGDYSILQADWRADDNWQIVTGEGKVQQVASWSSLLNMPALIILKFKMDNSKSAILLLCSGSVDDELNRQLRVRLNTTVGAAPGCD